ncbi:lipopolysaccharide biosynthesis protein [Kocuria sp. CH-021]|uniref:lipopolysaccharide biosynthesis protein n=1 Tax=Kocuria sp. CH-021 TaxID=3406735 RepID=UPI003C76CC16
MTAVFSGRLVAAGAQTLTVLLLARLSTPQDFGLVIGVQSAVIALTWILGFGLGPYMSVVRAREPDSVVVHEIHRLNKFVSVGLMVLLTIALCLSQLWFDHAWWFFPLILALGFQRDAAVLNSIAVADGRTRLFSSNLALRRVMALAIFAATAFMTVPIAFSFCASIAISEAICNWRLRRGIEFSPVGRPRIHARSILRDSKHYWMDTVGGQLRMLDVAVAGVVMGPVASGLMAVPSKIASPIMLIPTSLATLLLPRTSARGSISRSEFMIGAALATSAIAVILVGVGVYAEMIIVFMLGEQFQEAVAVTRIYFVGFICLSMIYMINAAMQGLKLGPLVSRASIGGSVLSLCGLCLGGFYGGLESAAMGYVMGIGIQLIALVALWRGRPSGGITRDVKELG